MLRPGVVLLAVGAACAGVATLKPLPLLYMEIVPIRVSTEG